MSEIELGSSSHREQSAHEARSFIRFFEWGNVVSEFLGAHFDGILSVFLFEIEPGHEDVDHRVWVLVGDIPPAYITCEDARNPYEALDGYIGAMEEWVQAAREGGSVADLIPVNVLATPANAALLDSRLKFLDEKILPLLKQSSARPRRQSRYLFNPRMNPISPGLPRAAQAFRLQHRVHRLEAQFDIVIDQHIVIVVPAMTSAAERTMRASIAIASTARLSRRSCSSLNEGGGESANAVLAGAPPPPVRLISASRP